MICVVEGCEREVFVKSRGYCKVHYSRWWKHGDPMIVKPAGFRPRPLGVCKFEGCENLEKLGCRGWCAKHHTRWYRHGDPSLDGNKFKKRKPIVARILARLSIGGFDECWVWQGGRLPNGYGVMDSTKYVHRRMYEHFRGEIGAGLQLHHTCEVKACANPKHLIPVTRKQHAALHKKVAA